MKLHRPRDLGDFWKNLTIINLVKGAVTAPLQMPSWIRQGAVTAPLQMPSFKKSPLNPLPDLRSAASLLDSAIA